MVYQPIKSGVVADNVKCHAFVSNLMKSSKVERQMKIQVIGSSRSHSNNFYSTKAFGREGTHFDSGVFRATEDEYPFIV